MKRAFLVVLVVLMAIVPSLSLVAETFDESRIVRHPDAAMANRINTVGPKVIWGVQQLYPKYKGRLSFGFYDLPDINAFASGDGHSIYVTPAMMSAIKSDDELAAVLNHEATHVAQKHHNSQLGNAVAWRIGTLLLGRALGASKDDTDMGSQIVTGIAVGGYSRRDENRADDGSVDLCVAEGYDPYAPAQILQTLQSQYGNGSAKKFVIGWFASHPDTRDRIKRVSERAGKVVAENPAMAYRPAAEPAPTARPRINGNIAVIVRDESRTSCYGFWRGQDVQEAIKGAMENELMAAGFQVVDQTSRDEAWDEQDLAKTGRMDPKTMPRVGKTAGARYFCYVTVSFYDIVEEGTVRVGDWNNNGRIKRVRATIKGKVKFEPVEQSKLAFVTPFTGSEAGYNSEVETSSRRGIDIDTEWESRPAGKAVDDACRDAVKAIASHYSTAATTTPRPTSVPEPKTIAKAVVPNMEEVVSFTLHVSPLPSEGKVPARDIIISAKRGDVMISEYVLFIKTVQGKRTLMGKVNFQKQVGSEIWGAIEFPSLSELPLDKQTTWELRNDSPGGDEDKPARP